jgi:histidinol-phosphate aminotransferase
MQKKIISKIVKPTINQIAKYIPGESLIDGKSDVIKLSSNESPFKIPSKVSAISKKIISEFNLYPDGDSNILKKALSKNFKINFSQIICGNGSDDILSLVAQAFSDQNSEIICSQYGFIYYPIVAKISGAKVLTAKTDGLKISCKNILSLITKKTKIIFFANPNNPTGTVILRNELIKFISSVPKNIIIVIDGAYSEFVTNNNYSNGLDLVKKFPNIVVTRTFSKIYALAGLRLGWAYSSKSIIEILEKIRGPFNVNSIAQNLGALILKEKKFLIKSINHNNKWQKKLPPIINSLGLKAYKTFANFILVEVREQNKKKKIISELLKKKIIIRDLDSYGLKKFFRVSIGKDSEMNIFTEALQSIMDKL